jgi:excisionase family DNA binding protein
VAAPDRSQPLPIISVRIPVAVEITGLSRSRIYELIKSGEIETSKVGASTLVLVESLKSFVERNRKPQSDAISSK